jgi:hypothetical protein|tara:strand:+ start:1648 stop:1884 length:237 start_codon:yes stop_codon:yes gene_type:complete
MISEKDKREKFLKQLDEVYAEMGREEPLVSKLKLYDETRVAATGFSDPCHICDGTGITYVSNGDGGAGNMPCPRCSEW